MSLRCGCPDAGDDIVFGPVHECRKTANRCECPYPNGAVTCPVHAEPRERPWQTTLGPDDMT